MKILIAIPVRSTILTKTISAVLQAQKQCPYESEIMFQDGPYVHENRNDVVRVAQKDEYTHIFFVDHDMTFEPMTLAKLLNYNKDIVCADYNFRFLPLKSMVDKVLPDAEDFFECKSIPMGCTLIKTSVFENLEKPWFFYGYDEEGNQVESEDYYFCKNVKKLGFRIWCDNTILVRHVGEYLY